MASVVHCTCLLNFLFYLLPKNPEYVISTAGVEAICSSPDLLPSSSSTPHSLLRLRLYGYTDWRSPQCVPNARLWCGSRPRALPAWQTEVSACVPSIHFVHYCLLFSVSTIELVEQARHMPTLGENLLTLMQRRCTERLFVVII
jgi:hypothetical protein